MNRAIFLVIVLGLLGGSFYFQERRHQKQAGELQELRSNYDSLRQSTQNIIHYDSLQDIIEKRLIDHTDSVIADIKRDIRNLGYHTNRLIQKDKYYEKKLDSLSAIIPALPNF